MEIILIFTLWVIFSLITGSIIQALEFVFTNTCVGATMIVIAGGAFAIVASCLIVQSIFVIGGTING